MWRLNWWLGMRIVKQLVVDDKWMQAIETALKVEIDYISQTLSNRINELAERYETSLPEMFRFQLNDKERDELVTNCDRFENLKHSSVNPYAFTGQVFDAYLFISDIIKKAESSIILIDNFIDETVLTMLGYNGLICATLASLILSL